MNLFAFIKPNPRRMAQKNDVGGLIKALQHKDAKIRMSAVEHLVCMGISAVPPLLATLGDLSSEEDLCYGAAVALCGIGHLGTMSPLIKYFARRGDPTCSFGLAQLFIEGMMKRYQAQAAEELIKIMIDDVHEASRRSPSSEMCYCKDMISLLSRIGPPLVEPLIPYINQNHPYEGRPIGGNVSLNVVEILGNIGDPRAVEPLIHALSSWTWFYTKPRIAMALGKIGDKRAIVPLSDILERMPSHPRSDSDGLIATEVIDALGDVGDAAAAKVMVEFKRAVEGYNASMMFSTISWSIEKALKKIEAREQKV